VNAAQVTNTRLEAFLSLAHLSYVTSFVGLTNPGSYPQD